MKIDDYIAHRKSIFYAKTDEPINRNRHEIVKRGSLIYRYSKAEDQPDQSMFVEQLVAEEAWKTGVPTVRIQAHNISDKTYQVMSCAIGPTIGEIKQSHIQKAAFANLGKILSQLHRIIAFDYGFIKPAQVGLWGVHTSWEDYLMTKLTEHLDYLLANQLVAEDQIGSIRDSMKTFVDRKVQVTPVLLHGDLNSHNIFVDESGYVTNIIDWEDALAGDPIYDLAFWATFHPEVEHQTLLKSYYTFAIKPKDFDFRFWTYYLRVSVSKLVQLHKYGYTDLERGKFRITRALEVLSTIK